MTASPGEAEVSAALEVRRRVFCVEQGVDPAAEFDGRDGEATHIVAVDEAGGVVGTCRLRSAGGICLLGRMAVDSARRGEGIGALMLAEAERVARDQGCSAIRLHAQLHAEPFYERGGYARRGGVFVEEGIEHVAMDLDLAPGPR